MGMGIVPPARTVHTHASLSSVTCRRAMTAHVASAPNAAYGSQGRLKATCPMTAPVFPASSEKRASSSACEHLKSRCSRTPNMVSSLVLRRHTLFHTLFLILSLISLFFILSFVSLGHVTSLSKDWVMWYDVTGTLVPIKGPGFHRIPGHSMGFYFLPCDVIHLCLFGHFSVVYIGHLYRVYRPRIDLV